MVHNQDDTNGDQEDKNMQEGQNDGFDRKISLESLQEIMVVLMQGCTNTFLNELTTADTSLGDAATLKSHKEEGKTDEQEDQTGVSDPELSPISYRFLIKKLIDNGYDWEFILNAMSADTNADIEFIKRVMVSEGLTDPDQENSDEPPGP